MADETKNVATESTETENQTTTEQSSTPTVEELMAQLASAKADAEKYKAANDKLSKSEAEMKRQLRAKQTTEEQEAEAAAEAQRIANEKMEAVLAENNRFRALSAYKNLDEKTVDLLLGAVSEGDHNSIAKIIENEVQKAVKAKEAEWLKSRPPVGSNSYSSMTREQIMAITDRDERLRAIAMNPHLFK